MTRAANLTRRHANFSQFHFKSWSWQRATQEVVMFSQDMREGFRRFATY